MKKIIIFTFVFFILTPRLFSSDIKLETIGILGGQNLYLTYLSLGFLYDSYEKGVYDPVFTSQMIKEIIAVCKKSKASVKDLINKNALTGSEEDLGNRIIESYDNLISEASSINSIIESDNNETIRQFEKNRNKAWEKLQNLLNIE